MRNVDDLLAASAQSRPGAAAIVDRGRVISYSELDERAGRLARTLVELGVRRGDCVAIYLDKSAEAVVAVYAILRAGACYVPLAPDAPAARLAYIARDANIRIGVTGTEKAADW